MRHSSGLRALGIAGALAILLTACSTTGAPTGGGAPTGPTATDPGKSFVFASTQFSPVLDTIKKIHISAAEKIASKA